MADLANLFDSPPSAPPLRDYAAPLRSPSASPGPSRSRDLPSTEALFLSPGSALDTPRAGSKRRSPFGDDEDRPFPPSPPAQPRFGPSHRHAAFPYGDDDDGARWTGAPSSSPGGGIGRMGQSGQGPAASGAAAMYMPDDVIFDPLAGLGMGGANGTGDLGDESGKKKRVLPKVDAERLMAENGLPALMKAAKRFKTHGKGAEAQDLKSLLNMYQVWAHGMFPKGDFAYTIGRVEKVCRTRRMESALSGYREAFNPRPKTPTPPPLGSPGRLTPPPPGEDGYDYQPEAGLNDAPSRGSSQPLFTPGDEPDYDELIAMEEAEREEEAAAARSSRAPTRPESAVATDDGPVMLEEEDEWEGLYN